MWRASVLILAGFLPAQALAGDRLVCTNLANLCPEMILQFPLGCTDTSLDSAINQASVVTGDTIYVGPGDYGSTHNVDKSVDVVGVTCNGVSTRPRFNQTGNDSIDVEGPVTATLTHIEIDGGSRCVRVRDGSTATFTDVVFDNCDRNSDGNGLLIEASGVVTIIDSRFEDSDVTSSGNQGAGIYMNGTSLDVVNTEFVNNTADDDGAALYIAGGTVTITGSLFDVNDTIGSGDVGAAIYMAGSTLTITDTDFTNNTSADAGGAVYLASGSTTITGGSFDSNTCVLRGGAINVQPSATLVVTDTLFVDNYASSATSGDGGAIVANNDVTLNNVTFRDNHVGHYGGALHLNNGGTIVTINGGVFELQSRIGTDVAIEGGAIFAAAGDLRVYGTLFQDLYANDRGGAISVCGPNACTVPLTVDGATFAGCDVGGGGNSDGGAIYEDSSGAVTIENSDFIGNNTADWGTVRLHGGSQTLSNNWFEGNTCAGGCGLRTTSNTTDTGSTYLDNIASNVGGAVIITDGSTSSTFSGCTFQGNQAGTGGGGAFYLEDAGTVQIVDAVMDGNTAVGSGGHIWADTPNDASMTVSITGGSFDNGFAGGHGGAIHGDRDVDLSITGSTFSGNTTDGDGGAIDWYPQNGASSIYVSDTAFDANQADVDADNSGNGGVLWGSSGFVSFMDNTLFANSAYRGGALYFDASMDDFELIRNHLCANDAANQGGGLWADGVGTSAPRTFENNLFTDNVSGQGGSGAYFVSSQAGVVNNDFLGNTSGNNQGAFYGSSFSGTFVNNLVGDNTGGGVYGNSFTATADYNAYWTNGTGDVTTNAGASWNAYGTNDLRSGTGFVDPMLTSYTPGDGVCDDDKLWPLAGSPLVDAGDPSISDPDASRSDIGAFGGPNMDIALFVDADGDGFSPATGDCDDANAAAHPGGVELPADGADGNCDGTELCYVDSDLDGAGNLNANTTPSASLTCTAPGVAATATDCNDGNAAVFPGAVEGLNDGVDQNCDGLELCPLDGDGDGYGGASTTTSSDLSCVAGNAANVTGDCNDANSGIHPGAVEVVNDGIDQNCDTMEACYKDGDLDGYGDDTPGVTVASANLSCADPGEAANALDCDDADATAYPGGVEVVADGIDQDCNGGDVCYADGDGDGIGTGTTVLSPNLSCAQAGESTRNDDCNDASPTVYPGAPEVVADGIDQDCDTDEVCYADTDVDTYGDIGGATVVSGDLDCVDGGEAATATDCDDGDADVHPGATENVANGVDEDCDNKELCYTDSDGDGQGSASTHLSNSLACTGPTDATNALDCNDTSPMVYDGAPEIVANGVDESCDGLEECWDDVDNDGYAGDLATGFTADLTCNSGGFSPIVEDCNDARADVNPAAVELAGDLFDQNCDGRELCFQDADRDGYGTTNTVLAVDVNCLTNRSESTLNTDCNDGNAAAHPGAAELVANGVDESCDTIELCWTDADNDDHGWTTTTPGAPGDLVCAGAFVANVSDDCDDTDATVYPGALELPADATDENCDGFELCWTDLDIDGYGSTTPKLSTNLNCTNPGESSRSDDCNDLDATIYPGAPEVPQDLIDQDCDGTDLNGCFQDLDLDGYGSPIVIYTIDPTCSAPGYSLIRTDCNDNDPNIHPGATDVCDGVDANCDGMGGPDTDEDADGLTWDDEQLLGTDGCVADTDGDTIIDGTEVDLGSDPLDNDSDGDGAGDAIEIGNPINPQDTDGDGTPDILDIDDDGDGATTVQEDIDGDGDPTNDDSDLDGTPDYLDTDDDGDLSDNALEDRNQNGNPFDDDTDGDGIPDFRDTDDDGDGVPSLLENLTPGADPYSIDSDGDFVLDGAEQPGDSDGDGIADIADPDDDGDNITTFEEGNQFADADGDGIPNYLDDDSDGDGKLDLIEGTGDDDNDFIPNFLDPDDNDGGASDADGDGILTNEENALGSSGTNPDTNGDGVDDGTEIGDPLAPLDTDGDGIPDWDDDDDDGDGLSTRDELGDECGDGSDVLVLYRTVLGVPTMYFQCGDGTELPVRSYRDTNGDGLPDYVDPDDDGDGVLTADEDRNGNGDWTDDDLDGDDLPDWLDPWDQDGPLGDLDLDGISNGDEDLLGTDPLSSDSDHDGIGDAEEVPLGDTDGDGVIDALDEDDDGDGIPTAEEGEGDIDGDGIPNRLDTDSDGDGNPDATEGTSDVDCDGIPNWGDPDDADQSCDSAPQSERDVIVFDGCDGCSSGGGAGAGWMALGLVSVALRRRRRDG